MKQTNSLIIISLGALMICCQNVDKRNESTNPYNLSHFEDRSSDYKMFINEIIRFYNEQSIGFDTIENLLNYAVPVKMIDSQNYSIPIDYSAQRKFLNRFHDSTISKIWYINKLMLYRDSVRYGYEINPLQEFMIHFGKIREDDQKLFEYTDYLIAMGDNELAWFRPLTIFKYSDTTTIERKLFWIVAAMTINDQENRLPADSIGPKMTVAQSIKNKSSNENNVIYEEIEEIKIDD